LASRYYYYFVASLPSISYGDKPPKSTVEFREECSYQLNPKDIALLPYCRYDPPMAVATLESTGSAFIDLLMLRERILALNLAFYRSGKLGRPVPPEPPQDIPRTVAVARAAFEIEDPLQAKIHIDRARWDALDTMVGLDEMFGVNYVYAHLLKLHLLERYQRLNFETGLKNYQERYNTVLDEYNSRI